MKRWMAFLLAAAMCFSLVGCGATTSDNAQLVEYQARVKELEAQLAEAETKISELESEVNSIEDNTSQQQDTPQNGNEFVVLNLGDSVTLDFVEFTVDSASWADVIKPTDTSSVYSYMSAKDNESYFWLSGTMKNTSGSAYTVDNIVSEVVFDDKYTYTAYLVADDGGNDLYGENVKPLSSVKYYIYVSAPDEIKEIYSSVTVKFGFADNFSRTLKFEECDYLYEVNLTK